MVGFAFFVLANLGCTWEFQGTEPSGKDAEGAETTLVIERILGNDPSNEAALYDGLILYGKNFQSDIKVFLVNESGERIPLEVDFLDEGEVRLRLPSEVVPGVYKLLAQIDEEEVETRVELLRGRDGLSCWDLNGNGRKDANEDINGDDSYNYLDCQGEKGQSGAVLTYQGVLAKAELEDLACGKSNLLAYYELDDVEPTEYWYCNGESWLLGWRDGAAAVRLYDTLIEVRPLESEDLCSAGGYELVSGKDDGSGGGEADDGLLQDGEILRREYLCHGLTGNDGADGISGEQGPQGEMGLVGPQGEMGPMGPQGEPGQETAPLPLITSMVAQPFTVSPGASAEIRVLAHDPSGSGLNYLFSVVEAEGGQVGQENANFTTYTAPVNEGFYTVEVEVTNVHGMVRGQVVVEVASAATVVRGFVEGKIRDAVDGGALAGVNLLIRDGSGQLVDFSETAEDGSYRLSLPAGVYFLQFEKEGYRAEQARVLVVGNQMTTLQTFLVIDELHLGPGAASGRVINAVTGQGVDNCALDFRPGYGTTVGEVVLSTASQPDGTWFAQLEAGVYSVEARLEGFVTNYFDVLIVGEEDRANQNVTISPVSGEQNLEQGQVRLVLTWGETPSDLDSHLIVPSEGGGLCDYAHIYYSDRGTNEDVYPHANLDVDDTSSYGPETITILRRLSGTYTYLVHDFTNRSSIPSLNMAASGAKVEVYVDQSLFATYYMPEEIPSTLWTVLELDGEVIQPVNRFGYHPEDTSTIGTPLGCGGDSSPQVTILNPPWGARVVQGEAVNLSGQAWDPEDGMLSGLSLWWTSDLDGALGSGADLTLDTLDLGLHLISLFARDSLGNEASASLNLEIVDYLDEVPPVVTITSPAEPLAVTQGDAVLLAGQAVDDVDGQLDEAALGWYSSLDGFLGTGAMLEVTTLSPGQHEIMLQAADAKGNQGFAAVQVQVLPAPIAYGQILFRADAETEVSWDFGGTWGLTDQVPFGGTFSYCDSPDGTYGSERNDAMTLLTPVDLTLALNPRLSFYAHWYFEHCCDFVYLELSRDGGATWEELDIIIGNQDVWSPREYDLQAYVSFELLLRFRLWTDVSVVYDGFYVDDLVIDDLGL
ncbi:MAG: hypothetical protein A2284_17495 [Deltaproteobacteria bacterium RIFOXYA12_FULL_61_11]|nr:MAG: hypothetical protein A2284_17495 [Deltaproteobacteria bacterium RIFOXYA12_FULL_61_11]